MKKLAAFVKRHKKLWIVLTVFIVIGAGITHFVHKTRDAMNELLLAMSANETAFVERRSLVESVSATGKIVSPDTESMISELLNVEILSVDVEVGDRVKAGDVLCVFDSGDLEESLANLKTSLANSSQLNNISISSAQRNLEELQTTQTIQMERLEQNILQAREDLDAAWEELHKAEDDYLNSDSAVNSTYAQYAAKLGTYNAYVAYMNSVSSGDVSGDSVSSPDADTMTIQLEAKKAERDDALAAYNSAVATRTAADTVLKQKIELVNARDAAYNTAVQSRDDAARNYQNQIASSQDSLNNVRISTSTSGTTEKKQIETYEKQIASCTVTAPIDGVVTQVNVKEGESYKGTVIAVIENTDSFEVSTEIDEYDIGKIKEGQQVVIKTNGTGDTELQGTVKKIAPRATQTMSAAAGGVTYNVVISVDTPSDMLRFDMTAKLSIIINSRENVLTVPYASVQEDEDGRFFVEVLEDKDTQDAASADAPEKNPEETSEEYSKDGTDTQAEKSNTRKIYVTKGIESDYYIEVISSEIKEGMEVIVISEEGTSLEDLLGIEGPMGGF